MPKVSGLGMYLYANGRNLSGDTNSISKMSGGPAVIEMTDITQSAPERQGGERSGALSWTSYFNPTNAHPFLSALPTGDVLTMVNYSQALGAAGFGIVCKQINYDGNRDNAGAFLLNVDVQSNSFGAEWGQQLTPGQRSDVAATNGTSVDYGAAVGTTAFGLQMHVQLFSFTGTSVTIKLQHSTDDAVGDPYTDIAGATSGALAAGPTAVRAATGVTSIKRWLRCVTTGTFSQATFAVVACRNLTATAF
jgi:hypothetical protein